MLQEEYVYACHLSNIGAAKNILVQSQNVLPDCIDKETYDNVLNQIKTWEKVLFTKCLERISDIGAIDKLDVQGFQPDGLNPYQEEW